MDWQPVAAGFKRLLPHGRKSRIQCDDDEGIIIDGCVARLRKYKPAEYELIIAHFVVGISPVQLQRSGNVQTEQFEKICKQLWGLLMDACHFLFNTMS